ncbi:bis(5'-nucleosyl)-tetraphosphatase (symmetrical) YqeK [Candidatus Margulisiibacteriota bacterium]
MHSKDRSITEKLKGMLDAPRFEHSLRVQQLSITLAKHYKADQEKASIAGLLHDCARYLSPNEFIIKAEELGLHIEPIMRFEPKLLHAPLSGCFAKTDFGIDDADVIAAIEKHTIGSPEMTVLEKIIYIADHVEPERNYPGVDKARDLMNENIDETVSIIASCMIKYLLEKEKPVHPLALETRNYHLRKAKKLW